MTNLVKSRDGVVGNTGWQTPPEVFDKLAKEFGPFDLDPASAHTAYTSEHVDLYVTPEGVFRWLPFDPLHELVMDLDGLTINWTGKVFCNPPYKHVEQWVKKGHDAAIHGALVVMLLIPSTDSRWFHRYVWDKRLHRPREGVEVRFLEGRIRFVHPDPARRETDFKGFRPISGNMVVVFHPWEASS